MINDKKELKKKLLELVSNYEYNSRLPIEEQNQNKFEAIKASFEFHYKHNEFYRNYCKGFGFDSSQLTSFEDISKIPTIPVQNFKLPDSGKMLTAKPKDIEYEMKSTGTSGIPSVSRRCVDTVDVATTAILSVYRNFFKISKGAGLFLFPSAAEMPEMGMVKVLNYFSGLLDESFVAVKEDKILYKEACDFLKKHEGKTSRHIIGPPFLVNKFMDYCEHNNIKFDLEEDSFAITLGGWKRYTGEMIPRETFKKKIQTNLGVAEANIRDMYGLAECNLLSIENSDFVKQVPYYAHFHNIKENSEQLEGIENNIGRGILSIYDPTIISYPGFIMTSDVVALGVEQSPEFNGQTIDYIERLPGVEFGCCAVNLDSFLDGKEK